MELRDLVREARGLPPGTLARAGTGFLLEEGRLRHETGKFDVLRGTRKIPPGATDEAEMLTSDLSRRRVYLLEHRDKSQLAREISIGRGEACDVRIELSSISSQHATIQRVDKRKWAITDGRSTNGTFVEGTRVRPGDTVILRPGQVVRFGSELKLTFLDGAMMERLLRQLDPVLRKHAEGAPSQAALSPEPGLEKLGATGADQVSLDHATLRHLELPDYLEGDTPNPGPGVATPSAAHPSLAAAEPPLALVCAPFAPVGLVSGIPVTVGRVAGNDLFLPHPHVSRLHARFERHGVTVTLKDLKTANGTFVNSKRIERAVLAPGAVVQIGPYEIYLVAQEAPAPGAGDPPGGATRVVSL